MSCNKAARRLLGLEIQPSAEPEHAIAPNLFKRLLDLQFRWSSQSGKIKLVFLLIEKASMCPPQPPSPSACSRVCFLKYTFLSHSLLFLRVYSEVIKKISFTPSKLSASHSAAQISPNKDSPRGITAPWWRVVCFEKFMKMMSIFLNLWPDLVTYFFLCLCHVHRETYSWQD